MQIPVFSSRELGAAVRAVRERRRLSQTQLAQQAGVERPWLVRLETGRLDNPTLGKVLDVVDALGCQLELAMKADPAGEPSLDELMGRS
ncbi:helix-turn-helix domain-containing protein [Agromyces italicus]|uniref:helix-turn-helix domain-containing protein n=1 Tax=Agromyces italicus TaxID=279572 RepID=UPI0003B5EB7F|nr:helix-turn-helix domain-containing protein [Agromyces italicus]